MSEKKDPAKVKIKIEKKEVKTEAIEDVVQVKEKEVDPKKKRELAVKEIHTKKQLPGELQDQIKKIQFRNLTICIAIMALICTFHLGYFNIEKAEFIVDLKFFAIVVLLIAIVLFEKAYKKDKGALWIYGIEALVFASYILFLPYIYFYSSTMIKAIFAISPLYFGVYYATKCIVIESRIKKEYYKNLSDVKEIVKKEGKKKK